MRMEGTEVAAVVATSASSSSRTPTTRPSTLPPFAVPADTDVIAFTNNDEGVARSVSIYEGEDAEEAVFEGEVFEGQERREYEVPALEGGNYFFRCEVHPEEMTGTLIAQEESAAPAA